MAFCIDAEFPGGNIAVDSIESDVVHLSPDLRDTTTDWFYWYFRVSGAEGRALTFVFHPRNIGVRGPAVSLDGGVNWRWLGAESVNSGKFTYTFPPEVFDVRFSVGMPYVRSNLDRFLATHRESGYLRIEPLTHTPLKRDVPLLLIEDSRPSFWIAVTCRQHACEMMASYALEGLIEGVLTDSPAGTWLRENAGFFIVPFMDADGVERGDQGKNRAPHDHNRDYKGEPIYNEVRALKERLPAWSGGRPLVTLDLHCPALSGPVHESVFFIEPEDRIQAARMDRLSECLWRAQQGPGLVMHPNKLAFGCGFNSAPHSTKQNFSSWSCDLPGALLGVSLEVAYANASGAEVNASSARKLGRDLAGALKDWLKDNLDAANLP